MEINKVEIYQGCTNNTMKINGVDIEDIPIEDIKNIIKDSLDKVEEKYYLKQIFEELLELNEDLILEEESSDQCDQCGDYIWDRVYIKK